VLPLIAGSDLLVVSSDDEGQPLVVGEALALGVPVVATAVGRVPELVGRDVGRVVTPGDPVALGEASAELALDEPLMATARRELAEETGFDPDAIAGSRLTDWCEQHDYEIYPHWRHRYAPGVTHNTEHVFGFCLPSTRAPTLSAREHLGFLWLPWREAAQRCFSMTNVAAIESLPKRLNRSEP
jgi:8-oxo-dGTP pyrophosphatase MutT (NUDIX family)